MVWGVFPELQSVSCGSLHQLGEEQLKPPPLPPRRKDAMSEAKVSPPLAVSVLCTEMDFIHFLFLSLFVS